MSRLITTENLGAWVLKGNPAANPDLRAATDGREHRLTRWCVVRGYRSELMAPGDKVVFWASGDGRLLARGIWGIGHVTGRVDGSGDVPLSVPLFAAGIAARELQAAGLGDLEVFRVPAGSNPSWVSRPQLAVLDRLLPPWPASPLAHGPAHGRAGPAARGADGA